jgi:hypothetical protein
MLYDGRFETICDVVAPKSKKKNPAGLQPTHHSVLTKDLLHNTDSEGVCINLYI